MMAKKIFKNKKIASLFIVALIIILTILIEVFVFNFNYFTLNQKDKGLIEVDINDLDLSNINIENDNLIIKEEDASIKINRYKYIAYLELQATDSKVHYRITIEDKKGNKTKEYEVNKQKVNFKVNLDSKDLVIKITNLGESKLEFKNLVIDNTFTFNYMRVGVVLACLFIIAYLVFCRNYAKENLHITFLIISLCIGMCVSILGPNYIGYDEKQHFIKAYKVSEFQLENDVKSNQHWINNIDDFFNDTDLTVSYKDKMNSIRLFNSRDYNFEANYTTTASTYVPIPYIPSATGLFIGKALKLPFMFTFYLGRVANVLFYSIVGSILIKRIRKLKKVLFVTLSFPYLVFSSGLYTADSMTIISALTVVTVFINMMASKEKEVRYKQIIIYTLAVCILIMSKVSYAPLSILIFAVPKSKFDDKVKVWISKFGSLCVAFFIALFTYKYATATTLNQWQIPGVDTHGQILYILRNPFTYANIMLESVLNNFYLYLFGSTTMTAYSEPISTFYSFIIIICIVVIAISESEGEIFVLKVKEKCLIAFSIISSWVLVMTALYVTFTPVASQTILGVQGRYFAPLMLPLILLFTNNKIYRKIDEKKLNYYIIFIVFTILLVLVKHLFTYNI